MKSPICSFDAKSGVLCTKCEAKLDSGEISQDDVDASIKLTRMAEKFAEVNRFTLVRAVPLGDEIALVLKSSDIRVIRSNNAILSKIEAEFKRKVWPIESESSDREFIEMLFYPTKVLSVNLFWLPDGSRLTKVIVAGSAERGKANLEKIKKIAKTVRNIELLTEYEH